MIYNVAKALLMIVLIVVVLTGAAKAEGYTNARVTETRWVGEEEPSTNCEAAEKRTQLIACLQKDRRVEVDMVYLNEKQRVQVQ